MDDLGTTTGDGTKTGDGTTTGDRTTTGDVITVENKDQILGELLNVLYARTYEGIYDSAHFALFSEDGRIVTGNNMEESSETTTYDCESGGRIDISEQPTLSGSIQTLGLVDGCRIGEYSYNGTVKDINNGLPPFATSEIFSEELTEFTKSQSETQYESITSSRMGGRTGVNRTLHNLSVSDFKKFESENALLIEGASTSLDSTSDDQTFNGFFRAKITAPWTNNEQLVVSSTKFSAPNNGQGGDRVVYTSGSLTAEAADGSSLNLNADNGDPDSFTLTIESDGSTSSFNVIWTVDNLLPCLFAEECIFSPPSIR